MAQRRTAQADTAKRGRDWADRARWLVEAVFCVGFAIALLAPHTRVGPAAAAAAVDGAMDAAASVEINPAPLTAALDLSIEALLEPVHHGAGAAMVRLRRGDALHDALVRAGVAAAQSGAAVAAMAEVFDARSLRAGQTVTLYLGPSGGEASVLRGFAFTPEPARTIHVSRKADGAYVARDLKTPLRRRIARATGEITESLYVDARRAGAHPITIAQIADVLAYTVDFQREIRPGDRFEIVFEDFIDPSGASVKVGELYYLSFTPAGRELAFWRHRPDNEDEAGFYNAKGESAKRFLMRTPINGARLSSHFGQRRHPVLGYTRMHKGTDFAAPRGTPIFAAGDGVIERANRFGSFGNYVRIRHADGYETAYAHLQKFHPRAKKGARVRQGQVIGYVGTTGRSTGPHLHYEVHRNGKAINPMTLRAPTGRTLTASDLAAFTVDKAFIDALRARAEDAADPLVVATR